MDANLLVYARVSSFPQHAAAREWLDLRLNGTVKVGLPWSSLIAFVRLVSNPRVFERPAPIQEGWQQVEEWLDCPAAWIPVPSENHRKVIASLLRLGSLRANHIPDAHLAALAMEHGLTLCSTDADFSRFPGLVWENPLA